LRAPQSQIPKIKSNVKFEHAHLEKFCGGKMPKFMNRYENENCNDEIKYRLQKTTNVHI
jgi:hypothetical protein